MTREEAIEYLEDILRDMWTIDSEVDAINMAIEVLEQPERKKGKWLRYGEDGFPNEIDTVAWQCDQCLTTYYGRTERIPNFCPNCGAKMEVEHD